MILALYSQGHRWQEVTAAVRRFCGVEIFDSAIALQSWMELNGIPSGLIIDLQDSQFENFLIRFSLRHPDVPLLTLTEQPEDRLLLRARAFVNRTQSPKDKTGLAKILLVDDSKTVRQHYREALTLAGYSVDVAENAQEGFDKASGKRYDLAIIDYFMPDSNGAELVEKLKKQESTYDLFCAILTGQYQQEVVDECLKAGAQECMFKNESFDLFLTRVHALVRSVQRKRQAESERGRLIGLLYSVSEGVFGVTADGRIQFVNPATLSLLDQSLSNLMGHYPHDCIHPIGSDGQPTTRDECFLQQAYTQQEELRCWRTLFQRADKTLFPVECNVNSLSNGQGHGGSVVVFRDISEQRRMEKNWQWQLSHDHLTGILNRSAFEEILNNTINRAKRMEEKSLLMFIDLDRFKVINDTMGHAAGDKLLVTLSNKLVAVSRDSDYVGRHSGDEFLVLCVQIEDEGMATIAEKFRAALEETALQWEGKQVQVTGSIGLAWIDHHTPDTQTAISQADLACAKAKQKGRNQWQLYRDSFEASELPGNWINRLQSAIENKSFSLSRQGVFNGQEPHNLLGYCCELQLREGDSLVSPELYQSNAKRFGLSVRIDETAIALLIERIRMLNIPVKSHSWYSLPFCIETLGQDKFPEKLLGMWQATGLMPEKLRLVINESDLFQHADWQSWLSNLRGIGFKVAINQFGTNLQTVLNLQQLPVDVLTLDTGLSERIEENPVSGNVVDALVKSAKVFQIKVQAVKVNTAVSLELLKAKEVDELQGNHIGSAKSF